MFAALGRFVNKFPWYIIGAWLLLAVIVIALAPKLTSTQDTSSFLPSKYESIKATNLQTKAFPTATQPGAILVFDRADGGKLTATDSAQITSIVATLNNSPKLDKTVFIPGVAGQPSKDGIVEIATFGLSAKSSGFDDHAFKAVKKLRTEAQAETKKTDADLHLGVAGQVAQQSDAQDASKSTLALVFIGTILIIVILLGLIFRSVIICLLPLLTVAIVQFVANGFIAWANQLFNLKADSSVQEILIVVLFGIGTDYILFLLFRYRERLRAGDDPKAALVTAMERAGEAIASAGGAVIVAFMALILSSLSIFRSIGPALAIAVAVTLVAALTLIPAVVSLLGRRLFWPTKKYLIEPEGAQFAKIGAAVGKRPVLYAAASGLILAVLAVFALGFTPSFDFDSSLPAKAESTKALHTLEAHLPAGETNPITVMLESTNGKQIDPTELPAYAKDIAAAKGINQVAPGIVSKDGKTALFSAILDGSPSSQAAEDNVRGPIRAAAHSHAPPGTRAYVGGQTSVFVDLGKAMARDYSIVFPVAALIILLILALLLRSLVAPLYLMASVGLGFAGTLGATVVMFQHIKGDSGLVFLLPIYIYMFVVALGTDYNILMIARLRDEARLGKPPREAVAEAIKHAGPTIGSAGLILTGSFATFMLAGNSLIVSLGFSLAFGIFVAAFVMAMFFTPALTAIIGHRAWWPGHGDETDDEHFARTGTHYEQH
ncbi:MAG TPA: MMPL family transporter, partial [Marmoricola sp.]|nr:MMPL family transporter [Marmoricola sp.]